MYLISNQRIIEALTSRCPLIPMALHDDVSIEVIEGSVALCTANPRAVIEALNLVVTTTWSFPYCISRKRDE
jgi:hypothetical protein